MQILLHSTFKQKILILAICFLLSVSVIIILFKISKAPNTYLNGFSRNFRDNLLLTPTYFKDLGSNGIYISGFTPSHIYVSVDINPDRLMVLSDTLSHLVYWNIPMSSSDRSYSDIALVDSPDIFIANREMGSLTLYQWQNDALKFIYEKKPPNIPFTKPEIISSTTLAYRTSDTGLRKNILEKWNKDDERLSLRKDVLEKQLDGFLCTDGLLNPDPSRTFLIYTYFYRNQFMALDSNLRVLYRGHTIDTTSHAKIKVTRMTSLDFYTFGAPPIIVNQLVTIGKGMIFIKSGLLADNEDRQIFGKTSVIDVYRLNDGKYLFSFHLLDFDGFKMDDFRLIDDHFVVIQGHYILYYPMLFKDLTKQ